MQSFEIRDKRVIEQLKSAGYSTAFDWYYVAITPEIPELVHGMVYQLRDNIFIAIYGTVLSLTDKTGEVLPIPETEKIQADVAHDRYTMNILDTYGFVYQKLHGSMALFRFWFPDDATSTVVEKDGVKITVVRHTRTHDLYIERGNNAIIKA